MGLETAFRAALTAIGDAVTTVRAMAVGPASVLGRAAEITAGQPADLVVFDATVEAEVSGPYRSKGHNEPLDGTRLQGEIRLTVRDGCIIYGPLSD